MRSMLLPLLLVVGCAGTVQNGATSMPTPPHSQPATEVDQDADKETRAGDSSEPSASNSGGAAVTSAAQHLANWRSSIDKIAEGCAMVTPQGCVSTYRFAFQAAERRVRSKPLLVAYCQILTMNDHLLAAIVNERIGLVAQYRGYSQVASPALLSCLEKQLPEARGTRLVRVANLAAAVALPLGRLKEVLALVDRHAAPKVARRGAYPALWPLPTQRWLALLKKTLERKEDHTAAQMISEMSQGGKRPSSERARLGAAIMPLATHAHLPLASAAATLIAERCAKEKGATLVAAAEKMAARKAIDLVYLNAMAILMGNPDDGMRLPRALERRLIAIWRGVLQDRGYSGAIRGTALWQIHEADPKLGAKLADRYEKHPTKMLRKAASRVLQQGTPAVEPDEPKGRKRK